MAINKENWYSLGAALAVVGLVAGFGTLMSYKTQARVRHEEAVYHLLLFEPRYGPLKKAINDEQKN